MDPRERYIYKTLASLMFVALGAIGLYLHHWEALPIVLGLLFSFGGDGFLALYDHKKHNYDFYLGIATFCLAQIAYSWHALEGGYTMWEPLLLAIGLTALAAVGIHLFQMKLRGGFLAAILVYSLLLTFAFSAALFRYFKDPSARLRCSWRWARRCFWPRMCSCSSNISIPVPTAISRPGTCRPIMWPSFCSA